MNPLVHFELPYEDRERAERFYGSAFGWKTQFLGPDMGDYVLLTTAEMDAKPNRPAGAIDGGMFPKRPDRPMQHPSIVIAVRNIARAMASVRGAGGEVLGEPHSFPNVGLYVSFVDTEGNRISMLEPVSG